MKKDSLHKVLPVLVFLISAGFIANIDKFSNKTTTQGGGETNLLLQKNAGEKRPNILFCIADDATFKHLSAYGCKWIKTPAFDRVAKEGLLFSNAYTPNAKCSPSRSCILIGRNSWQLEEAGNHVPYFPAKFKTFVETLAENGYQTGFTGKGWAPGNPGEINGNQRLLTGPGFNDKKLSPPTSGISAIDYASNFETFLNQRENGKPFCFWYGGHEPHRVYEYGSGVNKNGKKLSDVDDVPAFWMDNDTVRNDMLDYGLEIEYFDKQLEKILALLEKNNALDNTIIVVTSDNGMPFPRAKGHVYEYSNHLPLAIMWKEGIKNPGRKIDDFVSFIDFAPTFLQVAQVKNSHMQPIEGKSLLDIFKATNVQKRDHVLLGKERNDVGRPDDQGYPVRAIVKGQYLYLKNYEPARWPAANPETGYMDTDGSPTKTAILSAGRRNRKDFYWQLSFGKRSAEELYNLKTDPYCVENLAGKKDFQVVQNSLREQMEKELKAQNDPRILGKGYLFDQYLYAEPKVRDYYNRFKKGEKIKAAWINESDYEPDF
ncbi:sulfatase [Dyadobacter subterraneus]|uniref:Sulfatase n=1 Tax=Dyadobacter subterraneus TaxID=2773304 RepID=A0ABR9W7G6_9BACT|nr:sulfatase [Dyadobacter subterraneus]MBE9461411.1 sulfatase [Dyadobacter subterraneus]